MIKCYSVLAMLILNSCAMSPGEIALENKKLELMKAMASQPTIKCEQGCEYTDPNRNLSVFPKETNGWDFANKVLDTATTVSPWLAVTKIASDGIKSAGNNTTNTDSNNQSGGNTTSGDVDNSVTSGDVDNSSLDSNDDNSTTSGDVDNSTTDSNDNSSTTTTTDSNDNNSTVDSNDDNSVTNAAAESGGE